MATTRLLRTSKPLRHVPSPSTTSSSVTIVRCLGKAGFNTEKIGSEDVERKSKVAIKASVATSERVITSRPRFDQGIDLASLLAIDLASLLANVTNVVLKVLRQAVKPRPWKIQIFMERVMLDCRFFALFAVAGSLIGSILCFTEGCFLILESYFQYFHALSQGSDQGHMVHLLIEAIDMYLIGTAMLTFGMGLYVIFVGSKIMKEKGPQLPTWVEMESVSHGKSKIGHAVILILQAGMLEKFKSIPLITSLDLACLAGTLLISSASIFLLSRLSAVTSVVEDI